VLAIAATLVLVYADGLRNSERESGTPAQAEPRPWSAHEIEAWLPSKYEQARKVAGHRTEVVEVRCESRESLPTAQSILLDAFSCEVRAVTGQAESTLQLCGFNGVRATDGRFETEPTLLEIECTEDG
jgi:hypothetical protein